MTEDGFYSATVPVFQHYLRRISAIAAQPDVAAHLDVRLTTGMLSAGQNLMTAQGFVPRILAPLTDRVFPVLSEGSATSKRLIQRGDMLQNELAQCLPLDFKGADQKIVSHQAGDAILNQNAETFVTLYGMPNFFFHLIAGYSGLRAAGVALSKGDFDDFHSYATGFSFDDTLD